VQDDFERSHLPVSAMSTSRLGANLFSYAGQRYESLFHQNGARQATKLMSRRRREISFAGDTRRSQRASAGNAFWGCIHLVSSTSGVTFLPDEPQTLVLNAKMFFPPQARGREGKVSSCWQQKQASASIGFAQDLIKSGALYFFYVCAQTYVLSGA
jgi:hypothetical protein